MKRGRGLLYALAVIFGGLGVASCSAVNSYPVTGSRASDATQRSGVYYLPKHLLKVVLAGAEADPTVDISTIAVQDRSLALETGLALSPLSNDDITIGFDSSGLLKSVSSTLADKTADVVKEVAKLVVKFRDTTAPSAQLAELSFDPFDYAAAYRVNRSLARYGTCVEVEVRPGLWSPGCGKLSMGPNYSPQASIQPRLPDHLMPGIYYRRPASLMVHVVRKGRTTILKPLEFANASPIFRIDIRRTIFVERKTVISFENGALTSVQVVKPSEGLAIVQLPASVLQVVVDAATGGTAGARSAQLTAQANRENSEAVLNQAAAGRLLAGDNVNLPASRRASAGALPLAMTRSAALTQDELAACERLDFRSEECLRYYSE